jgi:endonuclease/exonuclease/phosphatase family protein
MKNLLSTLLLLLAIGVLPASAQKKVLYGVGFYNVENLFDTQHDPGKNDYEFLPTGSYQWTEQKYTAKLHNIAQVLSELCTEFGNKKNPAGAAVIGLSEVENGRALDDLLREPALAARGYRYVHFDGPDRRGVDVALLYNPKAFRLVEAQLIPYIYPTESQPDVDLGFYIDENGRVKGYPYQNGLLRGDTTYITRGFLTVEGYLGDEKFYFIVNHWPSRGAQSPVRERAGYQVRRLKEALLKQDPEARIVIMGDLNDDPGDLSVTSPEALGAKSDKNACAPHDLYNPWYDMLYKKGVGTLYYRGKWNLFDQIIFTGNLLNTADKSRLHLLTNAVFSRDYLLQTEGKYKGAPKRTTAGGTWLNGYSDHLPTQIFLVKDAR